MLGVFFLLLQQVPVSSLFKEEVRDVALTLGSTSFSLASVPCAQSVSLAMNLFTCAYVCSHVFVCIFMWHPEDIPWCYFSGGLSIFGDKDTHWPRDHHIG